MTEAATATSQRRDILTTIGYGAVIWIFATGLITTLGPEAGSWAGILVITIFAILAFGLAFLAYLLYRRTRTDSLTSRLLFGTGITTTGLLLDAVVYASAAGRYPLLAEAQQGPVAFFLISAYGTLLVAPHLTGKSGSCSAAD